MKEPPGGCRHSRVLVSTVNRSLPRISRSLEIDGVRKEKERLTAAPCPQEVIEFEQRWPAAQSLSKGMKVFGGAAGMTARIAPKLAWRKCLILAGFRRAKGEKVCRGH